jgi:hypothetical protein
MQIKKEELDKKLVSKKQNGSIINKNSQVKYKKYNIKSIILFILWKITTTTKKMLFLF